MNVNALLAQVPISWNVADNLATVSTVIQQANSQDLVVLPEGMASSSGQRNDSGIVAISS
jgi:predicted amidohydrolase